MTLRIVFFMVSCCISIGLLHTQDIPKKKVMIMEVKDEIDPRMTRYVELALANAVETKADYVILEMDTYGGTLTDAKEIVQKILDFKKPVSPLSLFVKGD